MAVYNCDCGLIISTSSERPRCLRCLSVLGPDDLAERATKPMAKATVPAVAFVGPRIQFCQVTMGYRLNERPVLSPIVRPR